MYTCRHVHLHVTIPLSYSSEEFMALVYMVVPSKTHELYFLSYVKSWYKLHYMYP